MLPRLDTETIRTNTDLVALAGADVTLTYYDKRDYYYGPCPFCGEGDDRFKVFNNADGQYFYCRRCERRGDVIQYTMMRTGLDFPSAAKRLNAADPPKVSTNPRQNSTQSALDGDRWIKWQNRAERMTTNALKALDDGLGDEIKAARRWLKDRGIGQHEIVNFGIGYNDQWRTVIPGCKLPPGILIPRWQAETCNIMAVNVYLNREAREMTKQRRMYLKGSRPKDCLFNEWRIPGHDVIVICEGELDAVLLSRYLTPLALAIATGGAATIPDDLSQLDDKRVILALDNDQAGQDGVKRWLARIPAATVVTIPTGTDITDYWEAGGDLAEWIGEHIG